MNADYQEEARQIVSRLRSLEGKYRRELRKAFSVFERHDPETVALAIDAFDHRDRAALWFGDRVQSLGYKTAWECVSEGRVVWVRQILSSIIWGIPM